jgi:hypothetical protein
LDCHKARLLFFFSHHLSLSTHPPPHAHLLSITLKHAKWADSSLEAQSLQEDPRVKIS